MAIKPTISSPFPLCFPIALRRQAAALLRRSSLLPPRPLANSGCSGEPLPLSLAQFTPLSHGASPDPELACSRALQVLLRFSRRARAAASSSASHSGETPTRLDPLPAPSASPCPCARLVSTVASRNPLYRAVAVAPPCSGELRWALTPVDPDPFTLSLWILIQRLDLALDHSLSACQRGKNPSQSDCATWLVQVSPWSTPFQIDLNPI